MDVSGLWGRRSTAFQSLRVGLSRSLCMLPQVQPLVTRDGGTGSTWLPAGYYFPWLPRVNCNVRALVAGRPLAEGFKIWGDWSLYSRKFGISSVIIWLQMALRRQQVACMVCWTNPKQKLRWRTAALLSSTASSIVMDSSLKDDIWVTTPLNPTA